MTARMRECMHECTQECMHDIMPEGIGALGIKTGCIHTTVETSHSACVINLCVGACGGVCVRVCKSVCAYMCV